ncbi:GerMN domain-containing protein [Oscillospiraceae bacterium CM]|nr:GerMN domain-containing protein [Oscillospiraceae bacterium CM]
MKKIAAALLIMALVITAAGCLPFGKKGQPTPTGTASPSPSTSDATVKDYFPFTSNVHMTYEGTGNEYAGFESWVDYVNNGAYQVRTNNGGTESVAVYLIDDGALKKVFSQGETYYRYDYTDKREMDETILMEPIIPGTSWTLPDGDTRAITATDLSVTVPYGTFKAVEVTTKSADTTVKEYYARDIGLIKREFISNSDPANPITSALKSVETGSPLTVNLRVYYPDFAGEKVKYVDKSISLQTGDDIKTKLEYEFKHVPTGSSLTPVMSTDAAIKSLTFDPATGVATIDFSKTFITGMNAGSTLEGLILASVADTVGSYFQTDKVAVTINGGPYESGHFLYNKGDLLPVDPDSAVPYK